MAKSFLRWAGSKQQLVPELSMHWCASKHKRYLEPFVGSAKLFFSLEAEQAILSDINQDLIEVFERIKKCPQKVFRIFQSIPVSKEEYYRIRSISPSELSRDERAARFIYLNKLCFNGIYRTNVKGHFNVPFSGVTKIDYQTELNVWKTASKKLYNAKIICGDFEMVVRENVKAGDFIYLDPPYAVANRRIFKQYGPQTFGLDDLKRMKDLLKFIDSKNASFLLSYAYCKEALDYFGDWPMKKKFTQRNVSGFAKYRRKAAELVVSNSFKVDE